MNGGWDGTFLRPLTPYYDEAHMHRRQYLAAVTGVVATTAGCVDANIGGGGGSGGGDPTPANLSQFEQRVEEATSPRTPVTWDGLKVTVNGALVSNFYQLKPEPDVPYLPPTRGAIWLLPKLTVENVNTERRPFPASDDVTVTFGQGQEARQFTESESFRINDDIYRNYHKQVEDDGLDSNGGFGGVEVSGRLLFEIPEAYDTDRLLIEIDWGGVNRRVERISWQLTPDVITTVEQTPVPSGTPTPTADSTTALTGTADTQSSKSN